MLDKYKNLVKEPKHLWSIKVTIVPVVVGTLGTVSQKMEKRLEELEIRRIETIQTRAVLKSITCCYKQKDLSVNIADPADYRVKPKEGRTLKKI